MKSSILYGIGIVCLWVVSFQTAAKVGGLPVRSNWVSVLTTASPHWEKPASGSGDDERNWLGEEDNGDDDNDFIPVSVKAKKKLSCKNSFTGISYQYLVLPATNSLSTVLVPRFITSVRTLLFLKYCSLQI